MVKVVKDIWKRRSFPTQSKSSSTSINSRNASRPIDGSLSTGRIKGKRIKKEKNNVQVQWNKTKNNAVTDRAFASRGEKISSSLKKFNCDQ